MDIETVVIKLGADEYTVRELTYRRSEEWRPLLASRIKPIFDKVSAVSNVSLENPADFEHLWPIIHTLLVESVPTILDVLCAYADELTAERETIEETATDRQIVKALGEVLKLADPFGLTRLLERRSGLRASLTSSSSPSADGASPITKPSISPPTTPSDSLVHT